MEIKQFDKSYLVSSDGSVYYNRPDGVLEPVPTHSNNGYLVTGRALKVHRMVAHCFIGPCDMGRHVHHINGNKLDNRAENLKYLTASEHMSFHSNKKFEDPAQRQAISDLRKGVKQSPELIEKRAAPLRGRKRDTPWLVGHKCTAEAIEIRRQASMKRCSIDGIEYDSVEAAALALDTKSVTLRMRFHRKTPGYKFI